MDRAVMEEGASREGRGRGKKETTIEQ